MSAAIGDNQASFLGAAAGEQDVMLVNMGTGGQFSVFSREYLECPGLETRPFPGGFLLVGSSLCGGRAYAILKTFFEKLERCIEVTAEQLYDRYTFQRSALKKQFPMLMDGMWVDSEDLRFDEPVKNSSFEGKM